MHALYTLGAIIGWLGLASIVAGLIALPFWCASAAADDLSDKLANGDWPHMPEGLAATRRNQRGEGCNSGQRPTHSDGIARRHGRGL